jgi:CRP-like cAMP-binding protein
MIDLIFIADILIRFRTTYIDPISGEEVDDGKRVMLRYLWSAGFVIDVLSSIPFYDLFGGSLIVQLFGTLKIMRIARISSVIMNLNNSQEIKALLKVINLVFYMVVYIHLMACLWFWFIDEKEEWIANKDFIWFGSPQVYDVFYTYGNRQYWTSFYTAFYLFGVGEVTPRTQTEVILSIPILIISSIMNGLIIGNMALYISELQKKQSDF